MLRRRSSFDRHRLRLQLFSVDWLFRLLVIFLHVAGAVSGFGAESVNGLRNAVSEWVDVEKAFSREALDWKEERQLLQDLASLARGEIETLQGEIESAREEGSDADDKRAQLLGAGAALDESEARISKFLGTMVPRLLQLKAQFPFPLNEALRSAYIKLGSQSSDAASGMAERTQVVVQILDTVQKFDRRITVSEEVRELGDGSSGIVTTLYLGLGAAYYLSEADDDAGIGWPSSSGWKWDSRPEIRSRIESVLQVVDQGGSQAAFVSLPFSLKD